MQPYRVFVVGSSLFAETLAKILGDSRTITVIGTAPTPEAALPRLGFASLKAMVAALEQEMAGKKDKRKSKKVLASPSALLDRRCV